MHSRGSWDTPKTPSDTERKDNHSFTDRILDLDWSSKLTSQQQSYFLTCLIKYIWNNTPQNHTALGFISDGMCQGLQSPKLQKLCWTFCIISLFFLHKKEVVLLAMPLQNYKNFNSSAQGEKGTWEELILYEISWYGNLIRTLEQLWVLLGLCYSLNVGLLVLLLSPLEKVISLPGETSPEFTWNLGFSYV